MYCLLRPCFQMSLNFVSRVKLKYIFLGSIFVAILDFFGAFTHILEISFNENFVYPYEGEVQQFVYQLRHDEKPEVDPINEYNYNFLFDIKDKCAETEYPSIRIIFLVKSASEHFDRRLAIRHSWGFEKRFSDVPSRTIFLLGNHPSDNEVRARVQLEAAKYKDIVQIDCMDTYYNNTIKTMMGFKWAINYCNNSKFYMFVDDDMYLSVKNVLRFVRNPTLYPDYLKPLDSAGLKREIDSNSIEAFKDRLGENYERKDTLEHKDSMQRISRQKRFTAKEKILLRQKPGWTSHDKTKFPIPKDKSDVVNRTLVQESHEETDITNSKATAKTRILDINEKERFSKYEDAGKRLIRRKRLTAKEKILSRRRPGWASHDKTKFPTREEKDNTNRALLVESHNEMNTRNTNDSIKSKIRSKRQVFDLELPEDVKLFAGYVFISSPHRHKTSKWYVPLEEYPYHLWPPYIAAGAYVLSKEALLEMYYTSLYTKHFRFDDIFLGLVAKKAEIEPFHCDEFHFYKKEYTKYNYKHVIASHGYDDPEELLRVWNEQKALGHA